MSEMMKNFAMLLWIACAVNSGSRPAQAQGIQEENAQMQTETAPTVVYGKSRRPDGTTDEVIVEQPDNNVNPLGNPLPEVIAEPGQPVQLPAGIKASASTAGKLQKAEKAQPDGNASSENLGKQFQNTLMEADGMVYDVQAYPVKDLKAIGNPSNPETIYSPNVNP